MCDYEGLPGYDSWKLATPPEYDDAYFGIDPQDEEEFPEPAITEDWNASRGEYETVVTFASGAKFSVRQVRDWDTWEVCGDNFYMDFATEKHALTWLTDIEHWGW